MSTFRDALARATRRTKLIAQHKTLRKPETRDDDYAEASTAFLFRDMRLQELHSQANAPLSAQPSGVARLYSRVFLDFAPAGDAATASLWAARKRRQHPLTV